MALDRPCSFGCGRFGRLTSDLCEVCAGNQSTWKKKRPAQRMKYRQRLALATRRQEDYAEALGDKLVVEDIPLIESKQKATVTRLSTYIKRRKRA